MDMSPRISAPRVKRIDSGARRLYQRGVFELRGFYAVLDRDDEDLARLLAKYACVLQVRLKPRGKRVDLEDIVRVARMRTRHARQTTTASRGSSAKHAAQAARRFALGLSASMAWT